MVLNPTNTGTGTGTDKYDPTGPFNIGQCNNQTRELLNTNNTNNMDTSNEDHLGNTGSGKFGHELSAGNNNIKPLCGIG
jgi:hypothetical protein